MSLCPSLTETLYDLAVGERVVGRTAYCPKPRRGRAPEAMGGTKNPDLARIAASSPDLILANAEENRREDVERMEEFAPVFVTHPETVEDVGTLLGLLGRLLDAPENLVAASRSRLGMRIAARRKDRSPIRRALAFIWRGPYWSIGGDTYASDLLRLCRLRNVFAKRRRYFPLGNEEIAASRPDVVLFPDEPWKFRPSHLPEFRAQFPALAGVPAKFFDGSLLTWHGTRTARALAELPALLA